MSKKFSSRFFPALAILIIGSILLGACASPATQAVDPTKAVSVEPTQETSAEPVKLVISSFYPIDKVSGWDGMLAEFKKTHPNVEIEVQVNTYAEHMTKLLSQIAGGDAPDIAGVENSVFPAFVANDMLMNLDSYMAKTPGFSVQDFFPHLMDRYSYNGSVYGIPYDAQPAGMLFYNPALFDAAGVPYPTKDWTWLQLRETALKLTKVAAEGNTEQYGVVGLYTPGYPFQGANFLYAWGGGYVNDLRNPTSSRLDEPKAAEALQFWVDLMYKDKVSPAPDVLDALGPTATVDLFTTGKAAMLLGGVFTAVAHPEAFKDLGVKMVMAPTGPDGTRMYPTGGTAYSILKTSKNPDLAWEFIQYFLGQVGYEQAYQSSKLGAMYPPAHIPSFDWYMQQEYSFIDTLQPNKDALDYITFSPYPLKWIEINAKCISPDIDLISRNQKPVAETLKSISDCVNSSLK